MDGLPLRLLIKGSGTLVFGSQRDRNDFELKEPPLGQGVQRKIAVLINASRHDLGLKIH
jgi:hypothetical protein